MPKPTAVYIAEVADNLRYRLAKALADAAHSETFHKPGPAWSGFRNMWLGYADAALSVVVPIISSLAVVNLDDPCVECGERFEKEDRVSWRLRFLPQGLIHEECQ